MSLISCSRSIHFCSAHRVMHHEGKCGTAHGHNFEACLTAEASQLDSVGRVIDFSILKEKVGTWIDIYWDHNFLVWEKDELVIKALLSMPRTKEPFICSFNPTAENMAKYLLEVVCPEQLIDTNVIVTRVVLQETKSCVATAELLRSSLYLA